MENNYAMLNTIVADIAEKQLIYLNKSGFIDGGHNGPYYDKETSVRNTAHFASIFAFMYKSTNEAKYYDAVKKCGDYLVSTDAMPNNSNFFCRYTTSKDSCNGTIGAAWAIEGLVESYKSTKNEKYIDTAQKAFLLFPYDKTRNVWQIVDTDGSLRNIDQTFNHQLWLAVAGVQILAVTENKTIEDYCTRFFQNVDGKFHIYSSGLIMHSLYTKSTIKDLLLTGYRRTRYFIKKLKTSKSLKYKENGYHLFNVYAFAIIKNAGWNIELFKSKKFKKILDYCFSEELYDWLENKSICTDISSMPKLKHDLINIYGYSYNAPGFELPYIYKVFKDRVDIDGRFVGNVVEKQIRLTYDDKGKTFSKNCEDAATLDARIYEYVRSI